MVQKLHVLNGYELDVYHYKLYVQTLIIVTKQHKHCMELWATMS